ncbi:hypothetical protein L7F22_037042 [Adiantum nelumboides]|nr:hypothetical protein [Adiantum nelumboides]
MRMKGRRDNVEKEEKHQPTICMCVCVCVLCERERERERESAGEGRNVQEASGGGAEREKDGGGGRDEKARGGGGGDGGAVRGRHKAAREEGAGGGGGALPPLCRRQGGLCGLRQRARGVSHAALALARKEPGARLLAVRPLALDLSLRTPAHTSLAHRPRRRHPPLLFLPAAPRTRARPHALLVLLLRLPAPLQVLPLLWLPPAGDLVTTRIRTHNVISPRKTSILYSLDL